MDGFIYLAFIGPGGPEILVVMLALLVMFGAKDAPRIFRKINEVLNQIRSTAEHFRHEMMYSDLHSEAASDNDLGDYDDYGLGVDRDEDHAADPEEEPGADEGSVQGKHGDGDVKSV